MAKMKVSDFLAMLMKAESVKTLYVMGGWGFPLTEANKKRAYTNPYNTRNDRKPLIEKASADTFAFDCCGVVRSVLWGWNGDTSAKNGGAVYGANGVPEYDAKQFMFQGCTEQSSDFSKIEAGEFLWMDGHCGAYIGNGLAIESTPKWKDGVQITAVANIAQKAGYNSRTWTYHGHLKYVDYDAKPDPKTLDGYTVGYSYYIVCSELNVRTMAEVSDQSKIVGVLKQGTQIVCKALTHDFEGNTWMRIDSPLSGWLACLYKGARYVDKHAQGWEKEDGKWYYYKDDVMLTSSWVRWKGDSYYVGSDGAMVIGWQKIGSLSYYFYKDGRMARGEWIDGKFLDMDGVQDYTFKAAWKKDEAGSYFQDNSGWYAKNRTIMIDGKAYTFDKKGYTV